LSANVWHGVGGFEKRVEGDVTAKAGCGIRMPESHRLQARFQTDFHRDSEAAFKMQYQEPVRAGRYAEMTLRNQSTVQPCEQVMCDERRYDGYMCGYGTVTCDNELRWYPVYMQPAAVPLPAVADIVQSPSYVVPASVSENVAVQYMQHEPSHVVATKAPSPVPSSAADERRRKAIAKGRRIFEKYKLKKAKADATPSATRAPLDVTVKQEAVVVNAMSPRMPDYVAMEYLRQAQEERLQAEIMYRRTEWLQQQMEQARQVMEHNSALAAVSSVPVVQMPVPSVPAEPVNVTVPHEAAVVETSAKKTPVAVMPPATGVVTNQRRCDGNVSAADDFDQAWNALRQLSVAEPSKSLL
jgi:hypothetical protein